MGFIEKLGRTEIPIDPKSVAIITTTLYRGWYPGELKDISHTDKVRGDLSLETIKEARKKGYQIMVADDPQSSEAFKEQIHQENIAVLPRESEDRTLVFIDALSNALQTDGVQAIVFTQPEKDSLIRDGIVKIAGPLINGDAHLVVPKRNEELFQKTYPDYMYRSEKSGNGYANRLLHTYLGARKDYDLFFGPIAFRADEHVLRSALETFQFIRDSGKAYMKYAGDGLSSFPVASALYEELTVESVEVPFQYPGAQKENELNPNEISKFRNKRWEQRKKILTELVHFIRYLRHDPKGRLVEFHQDEAGETEQ